jgi:thiol:disulfide interchange protein
MDKTEQPSGPDLRSPQGGGGSQSKLSPILFWVLLAAVLFRVVTTVTDKDKKGAGEGLVHWQQHESAPALAARAQKPILYDFTAAWCVPCHRLDKEAWGDDRIAGKVNAGFIPARVVDRQREDGKNAPSIQELQRRYGIQAFPTLVIADPSGREIARSEGFRDKDSLIKFLDLGPAAPAAAVSGPGT